jgi:uncharacterized membrane protein
MSIDALLRLALLYSHFLLCVFALHAVLSSDWRLLRSRISASRLKRTDRTVGLLLGGLWITGLALIALDSEGRWAHVADNPKVLAKLACVVMLTANAVMLRRWCFPRLMSHAPLRRWEACVLMSCGAISTTCWLMAGFFGLAGPLRQWPLSHSLLLLGAALAVALPVAVCLQGRLRRRHG